MIDCSGVLIKYMESSMHDWFSCKEILRSWEIKYGWKNTNWSVRGLWWDKQEAGQPRFWWCWLVKHRSACEVFSNFLLNKTHPQQPNSKLKQQTPSQNQTSKATHFVWLPSSNSWIPCSVLSKADRTRGAFWRSTFYNPCRNLSQNIILNTQEEARRNLTIASYLIPATQSGHGCTYIMGCSLPIKGCIKTGGGGMGERREYGRNFQKNWEFVVGKRQPWMRVEVFARGSRLRYLQEGVGWANNPGEKINGKLLLLLLINQLGLGFFSPSPPKVHTLCWLRVW